MKFKKKIAKLTLIILIVSGGFYLIKKNNLIKKSKVLNNLEGKKEEIEGTVKGITDNISNQTKELTKRGQKVSEHVNNILGTYIEPTNTDENQSTNVKSQSSESNNQSSSNSTSNDENKNTKNNGNQNDKPVYEKTFDYGRYLYCQQVIKDYEQNHP